MTVQRKTMIFFTAAFLFVLLSIAFGLLYQGRDDYAQNIGIKIALWLIYTCLEIKYDINLSNKIRASVMLVIISDSFFGLYLDLYTTSSIFDKVQHVFGSYAFALFAYCIIYKLTKPVIGREFTFIFILVLGLSIGAGYEIGEFIGDQVTHPRIPSQPNLLDTNLDLIADIIGSLVAAIQLTYRKQLQL